MANKANGFTPEQFSIIMANKANGFTPEQRAILRQMLGSRVAPVAPDEKATSAAKVEVIAAGVSGADSICTDLVAAGAAIIRTGKSGVTGSGKARVWVDVSIGGIRLSGNAYRNGKA